MAGAGAGCHSFQDAMNFMQPHAFGCTVSICGGRIEKKRQHNPYSKGSRNISRNN